MTSSCNVIELALLITSFFEHVFLVATLPETLEYILLLHAFDKAKLGALAFDAQEFQLAFERTNLFSKVLPMSIEHLELMSWSTITVNFERTHAFTQLFDRSSK